LTPRLRWSRAGGNKVCLPVSLNITRTAVRVKPILGTGPALRLWPMAHEKVYFQAYGSGVVQRLKPHPHPVVLGDVVIFERIVSFAPQGTPEGHFLSLRPPRPGWTPR
jgi:hypothetical protein